VEAITYKAADIPSVGIIRRRASAIEKVLQLSRIGVVGFASAATIVGFPALAQDEQTFYSLVSDTASAQLLALDTIDGNGASRTVLIVDLYGKPSKSGTIFTWEINCSRHTMHIVKGMQISSSGSGRPQTIASKAMSTRSSDRSRLIENLVCTGKGNLEKSRVIRGSIKEVIRDFWNSH
jgi:hypothetical protein